MVTIAPERGVHSERMRRQLLSRTFNGPEIEELTHSLGIEQTKGKIAQSMLPEILALRQQGKSLCEIGRLLGFTHQAIGRALCGSEGTCVPSMTSQAEAHSHPAGDRLQQGTS